VGVAVPDPVRVSIVGVLAALLTREMIPDAVPLARGVKVKVSDTLCPAAMVLGKDIPPRMNSELLEVAEDRIALEPVAVRVAVRVLLAPTATLPKFKAVALEVIRPAGIPFPDRAIDKSGVEAFETIAIRPLAFPPTLGAKRRLKVTLCPLFRFRGNLRPLKLNPTPVTVACEIVTVELPELVNVSYWARLLPTWILPKPTLIGLAVRRFPLVEDEDAALVANITKNEIINTTIGRREKRWGQNMARILNRLRQGS
jgi:hypothetical protein